jgi:hypothetical protein
MQKIFMLMLIMIIALTQLGCAAVAGGIVGGAVGHELAEDDDDE